MIQLTEQQLRSLEHSDALPPRILNPETNEMFVLLRVEEFESLKAKDYDDSPWTREELEALAWERMKDEAVDEYDSLATRRIPTNR